MRQKKLPIAALERIDDLCAEFERKWQTRRTTVDRIAGCVAGEATPSERDALLAELIVLDVDYRRRRGETPTEQEYLGAISPKMPRLSTTLSTRATSRPAHSSLRRHRTTGRVVSLASDYGTHRCWWHGSRLQGSSNRTRSRCRAQDSTGGVRSRRQVRAAVYA